MIVDGDLFVRNFNVWTAFKVVGQVRSDIEYVFDVVLTQRLPVHGAFRVAEVKVCDNLDRE